LGERVLLCKRNIEPRKGKWTLPAGFMELGESTAEGAARETTEEAGAQFEIGQLITVMSVPRVGQVHLYYLAELQSEEFNPGFETQETRMFLESEIPWEELAFRTVQETLKHYFADRQAGQFQIHAFNID
jgi:ADP-ribose pyrophosphatase YjhB (NUDIX family)